VPAVVFLGSVFLPVLVLAVTALILGRTLQGQAGWAVQTALGLALFAHGALLLGFAGLLKPLPVLAGAALIHLLGLPAWRGWLRDLQEIRARAVLLGIVIAAPFLLLALYPPEGFDETLYHLPFARGFVASGGVPFLPDLRFPVFPQANEILFALVMLFGADVAAHGVQCLMTLTTAAILVGWGREAFPESGGAAGWIAAAVFLGNPIVASLAGSGYVEPGLTLFATAALDSARRFRRTGERGWLVLAAVFAGTAADVKYLGLFFLGMTALAVVLARRPIASRVRDLLLFGAVATVVVAPWYGRMFVHTGNPLFPFFPQLFGTSFWSPLRFHSFAQGGVVRRLIALVRLPWDVVFARDRYGFQPPYSPAWLLLLPAAALAAFRDARLRRLLGIPVLYALACLSLPPDSRYLVPVLPLVSLAAAGTLVLLIPRLPVRREALVLGLCAGCLLPGWLYPGYRISRQGPIPLTPVAREAYLARRLPVYPAVSFLNRTRGNGYTVWALDAENMVYHARGRLWGDWIGPASFFRVLDGVRGPEDLHRRLRSLGADYLLIAEAKRDLPFPEDASFRRWFRPVYSDAHARVYELAREEG
jgi:hypothetical protein